MPRIRTLKPELWDSPDVMQLSNGHALLWIWLITQADDEGRLHGDENHVATRFHRLSRGQVKDAFKAMRQARMLETYEVQGQPYVQIINWHKHQRINRPTNSTLPGRPVAEQLALNEDSRNAHGVARVRGSDRKGRETERIVTPPPSAPPRGGRGLEKLSTQLARRGLLPGGENG